MSPQQINSVSELTLKSRQVKLIAGDFDLCLNFADVIKERNDAYINATEFLKKQSGKKVRVEDYLKMSSTKDYIAALEHDSFKSGDSTTIRKGTYFRKAGRYGGTWMCKMLFIDFARWIDPALSVACNRILLQIFEHAYELSEARQQLKQIQRPLTDAIKEHLVDKGIKEDIPATYIQFQTMIKRLIGSPEGENRDTYTAHQMKTAKRIVEEYRGMIVHGGKISLKEMNEYMKESNLNLAWKKE